MAKRTTPPISKDNDLSGPLPRELLLEWRDSSRSVAHGWELLKPALIEGTVLSGDGSRLTLLSHQLEPVELAARVDRTQRIVYGLATAAGGRAPGAPWTADNFQLFFPPQAPVEFVIGAALEMHKRLAADPHALPVCIAIHKGVFYDLGGTLYGEEAALVEFLAEESAQAGETLITRAALDGLRPSTKLSTARRADLDHLETEIHRVTPGASLPAPLSMAGRGGTYPLPYAATFHEDLKVIDDLVKWPERRAKLGDAFAAERTLVMVELCASAPTRPHEILEAAMRDSRISQTIARLLPEGGELIVNSGGSILATFLESAPAMEFAGRVGQALFDIDLQVQIGLDRGTVLLVPPDETDEPWCVLGRPVCVASKLCHELGEPNQIRFTDRASAGVTLPGEPTRFSEQVSGVTIEGGLLELGA